MAEGELMHLKNSKSFPSTPSHLPLFLTSATFNFSDIPDYPRVNVINWINLFYDNTASGFYEGIQLMSGSTWVDI